jgi:hypothetical protein
MFNSRALAMRDPALAALMGIGPDGSDFGCDPSFGFDANGDADMGAEFGGYDFGQDAAPTAPIGPPTQREAINLWNEHKMAKQNEDRRMRMLDPNGNSRLKVEQYLFPLAQNVVIGTATALNLTNQPDVTLRPQRVLMNSPANGFATISEIRVANVAVTVGGGTSFDAFFVSALGVGVRMDMPTLTPANRATVTGTTTTLVPTGYVLAATFPFSVSFIGPARMAG